MDTKRQIWRTLKQKWHFKKILKFSYNTLYVGIMYIKFGYVIYSGRDVHVTC